MAKDSELSPERLAQRERLRKRVWMNALDRQHDVLTRMRLNPMFNKASVAQAEAAYEAKRNKIKSKYPNWFE